MAGEDGASPHLGADRDGRSGLREDGPTSGDIIVLALIAWFLGLVSAAVAVLPAMVAFRELTTEPFLETLLPRIIGLVGLIPSSLLMVFTLGLVLSFPLFLIGLGVALLARRQIAAHPIMMAMVAPILAGAIVAAFLAMSGRGWVLNDGLGQRILQGALSGDTLIFAIPVAVASVFYCFCFARHGTRGRPG